MTLQDIRNAVAIRIEIIERRIKESGKLPGEYDLGKLSSLKTMQILLKDRTQQQHTTQ